jgi:hypothetical protein
LVIWASWRPFGEARNASISASVKFPPTVPREIIIRVRAR